MIGIYKFTNRITGESYVGQSVDIEKRYKQHKRRVELTYDWEDTYFHRMLRKYGFENFDFEILEECSQQELNEREIYYIDKYNALFPNGYNMSKGGKYSANKKIDFEQREEIYNLLKNSSMTITDIANKFGLHINTVSQANRGELWFDENTKYPIREQKVEHVCENCGKNLKYKNKNGLCKECYLEYISRNMPNKKCLYNLLLGNSFECVGRMFGVTGNSVRKWCDKYEIPRNSSYYRSISKK